MTNDSPATDAPSRPPDRVEELRHELGVHQVELETQNEQLRQTQVELETVRDRYMALYDDAPVGYLTMTPGGTIVQANRKALLMLAPPSVDTVIGRMLHEFVAFEDRPAMQRHQMRALNSGMPQAFDLRLAPHNGTPGSWVSIQMVLVKSDANEALCRVTLDDITERVRLREGVARLAAIVESSEDAIVGRDPQGRVTSWNDAAARLFGIPAANMLGHTMDALVPPERRAEESRVLRQLRDGLKVEHLDTERLGHDGQPIPLSIGLSPVRDERGAVVGSSLIARDISDRQRSERAQHDRMRKLELLAEVGKALILGQRHDEHTLREDLFERVRVGVRADVQMVYHLDDSGQRLVLQSFGGLSEAQRAALAEAALDESLCGVVVRRNAPLDVPNLQSTASREGERLRAAGLHCFAAYPLCLKGRLYGVLAFGSSSRERFSEGDLLVIRSVCDQYAAWLERVHLIDELHASEQSLRDTHRAKDDFIATLAHELRNPLAPVRNAVGVLRQQGPVDARQLAWCRDVIERQVMHMTHLLEDLLDVSRLTRKKVALRLDRIELMSALQQSIESARPALKAQRLELELDLPAEPIELYADVTRLTQVFTNVLNNASKYTDPGGRVTLTVRREGEQAVRVAVRDTGIGIDAQQLARVFDMFAQLMPALGRAGGGLGIGLAISRGLVELHGGTIEAHSAGTGQGSEFVVHLPALAPQRQADAGPARGGHAPAPQLASRRLLVVDDNVDAAQTLGTLLELYGQEVRTAFGGVEALRIAREWLPDVALLDIGMPDLNGYELGRRLRELAAGRPMLMVACTGWGQDEDRELARAAGYDAHLVKPVDPDALLEMVERAPRPAG